VQIRSEDGRYFNCESRERTYATLQLGHWEPVEDEEARNKAFFTRTHVVIVLAVLAFPLVLVVCGICLTVGRECVRERPRAKAKA
jgi:hypothetical protein